MKMFMIYLCEGTKTLFRMGYAIMKKLHELIINVKEPPKMLETLKKHGPITINDSEYILKWAFKMALTRNNNSYSEQKAQTDMVGLKLDAKVIATPLHILDHDAL